jgi:hypothetical protein
MKPLITLLLLCALTACEDNETSYSVSPELTPYIDEFYNQAEAHGKSLPKNNLIAGLNSSCQSITQISKDDEQWTLEFDKEIFQGMPQNNIEAYIFHELGRIVLKRELSSEFSIMNPNIKVNGFATSDRETLLDELFK